LQIILIQLDLILSNTDPLKFIYSSFRVRAFPENAYYMRIINCIHV